MPSDPPAPAPARAAGARGALLLLLGINLFNYIDRQVLSAILPKLQLDAQMFSPADPRLQTKLGALSAAFMVTYMLCAPVFGALGDRAGRWRLVGLGVIVWSVACAGGGWATGFALLLLSRCLVGVGEAAYGPVAPSMLADLYPAARRGAILSWFYAAIPVGSALGFVIGGAVADSALGWRGALQVVMPPGILLGLVCFAMREPARTQAAAARERFAEVLAYLRRIPSFVCCCAGMTMTTFVLGGIAVWMPLYIFKSRARFEMSDASLDKVALVRNDRDERIVPDDVVAALRPAAAAGELTSEQLLGVMTRSLPPEQVEQYAARLYEELVAPGSPTLGDVTLPFGAIVAASGLTATLAGGALGGWLRGRVRGAYFQVCGWTTIAAWPFFVASLYAPYPLAWGLLFVAVFGMFLNTGPANTILADVVSSRLRASAFAVNILIIHALGDVISPVAIGFLADLTTLRTAIVAVATLLLLGGGIWVYGARYLDADTARAG